MPGRTPALGAEGRPGGLKHSSEVQGGMKSEASELERVRRKDTERFSSGVM